MSAPARFQNELAYRSRLPPPYTTHHWGDAGNGLPYASHALSPPQYFAHTHCLARPLSSVKEKAGWPWAFQRYDQRS
ncbi:hypothetical protein M438DRAFT_342144 [Aureobasidium pullulans EXF-150]|uniref:Uncharacterized protein n=1 Tax=Aureobasidium pullulans EXF-150 TaxID=1043002 RepID=A0A074XSJ7_AURPU|nr:uncharacterized protein M438DRAFT_342144 [Aureobasidium pullulans EXF-150]KEQ88568.1 hypothetical protein M438DRAFT_342144 [Aureobasidium pullulans EXF-150]